MFAQQSQESTRWNLLIKEIIFKVDNFIVQLLDKFAGMIGQRIAHIHQPPSAIGRTRALFQIAHHIVQRQHFALSGRNN
ncbi:Uncharacterised protein [Shigella sonnei]|nr:Uncharacterised protein [Shigella sonnei]